MPIQTAIDSISNSQGSPFGFKNRIINGGMVIDQRNAGSSVTAASESYTLDRWYFAITQSSKLTCQQNAGSVTPPPGFNNYLGITSSSSYSVLSSDLFSLKHSIEGYNTSDLGFGTVNAQTVTLSFWVRSSLTGTFGASFVNNAFNRSFVFTYTINSANTWEYKTVTIAGDKSGTWVGATNGIGLRIYFNLGAGSTYSAGTANTWNDGGYAGPAGTVSVVGTNGATFYITGVQIEKGTQATSFDYRPYGTELAMCQRYFQKSFNQSLAVGTTGSLSGAINLITYVTSSTYAAIPVQLTPQMRATPTVTWYSYVNGATGKLVVNGTNYDVDAQTGYYSDSRIYFGWESNATGNRQILGHYAASAEL